MSRAVSQIILLCLLCCIQFHESQQTEANLQMNDSMHSCPPWKYDKYHNSSCACGDSLNGVVVCNDQQSTIKLLSCTGMSYADHGNATLAGSCPYLCSDTFYIKVYNTTDIDGLCDREIRQNRHGQMCGRCRDNFSPSPYSYSLVCNNCSDYKYSGLKYVFIAYLPLTVFFLVVIFFQCNALSPSVSGLILICQLAGCFASLNVFSTYLQEKGHDGTYPFMIMSCLYGIWNLDFFRMFYRPFCLHPSMSTLHILALDYGIAVYPLFLICVTYVFVKLHDKFEKVQAICKPAAWAFNYFNQQWKKSNSLIQAFGTFLLLSYVKILNTSFNLLMPVQLHDMKRHLFGTYLYYNGSMEYFGKDHIPFGILAIFMFTTFNLVPLLLLCLYPCRCFQSCLNCCRLNSQVLRTFMDAFQGCYKFEPYDCRYWAALYLFLRLAFLALYATAQGGYTLFLAGVLFIPIVILLVVIQPYKKSVYTTIDIVLFLVLILGVFAAFVNASYDRRYYQFGSIVACMATVIPILYMLFLVLKLVVTSRMVTAVKMRLQHVLRRGRMESTIEDGEDDPLLQNLIGSDRNIL